MPVTSIKQISPPNRRPPALEDFPLLFNMVASNISLNKACKNLGLHYPTVQSRLSGDSNLAREYLLAKAYRAEMLADKVIETSEDVIDSATDENGVMNPNAAQVGINGLKWAAAQLDPKNWGQATLKQEITGKDGKDLNLGAQVVVFMLPDNGR